MFSPSAQLVTGLLFAMVVFLSLWFVQLFTRDAGVVDVGWSVMLGLLALFDGVSLLQPSARSWLVALLASVWSFRLGTHLLFDRVLGKEEDGRYQNLRARFVERAQLFFFAFFQIQALLAWAFSLVFWLAMRRQGDLDVWDFTGALIWLVAFIGETIADTQLARFRSNPANRAKTCRAGLWRYSRHPNYFCEWLYWWVFVVIAWDSALGPLTLIAPALMLFFLFKVTGIPTTEAQALISRGDDYRDYQRTTSVFFPWFPKQTP